MSISGVGAGASSVRAFEPPSFSSLDGNSDGGVSLDELQEGGPKLGSAAKDAEHAEKVFSAMDTDGDGSVTETEKTAFDDQMEAQRSAMQFLAQQFGSEQSGSSERPAGPPPGGPPPPGGADSLPSNEDIFAATDSDDDGSITLAEFSDSDGADALSDDQLSELFSAIDGDGDGEISAAESDEFLTDLRSEVASASSSGRPEGPPPGGRGGPPPPPPPSDESDSETADSSDASSVSADLLAAASAAYSTVSDSAEDDLISMLTDVFDQAA